jgi:hypothetical protein
MKYKIDIKEFVDSGAEMFVQALASLCGYKAIPLPMTHRRLTEKNTSFYMRIENNSVEFIVDSGAAATFCLIEGEPV